MRRIALIGGRPAQQLASAPPAGALLVDQAMATVG
jgi:hypothetical protein